MSTEASGPQELSGDGHGTPAAPDYLPNLRIVLGELDRQTLYYERRFDSIQSKAALLVTGAAVLAGLGVSRNALVTLGVVGPALAAAVLGTLVLWPRGAPGLSAKGVRASLLPVSAVLPSEQSALFKLIDTRAHILDQDEERLKRMAPRLRGGFVLLGVSLVPLILEALARIAIALTR